MVYRKDHRTGSVLTSVFQTPRFQAVNGLHGNVLLGLVGLLFSLAKGLLLFCPTVLLVILCWRKFVQKYRSEALFLNSVTVGWLLLHAKLDLWDGGWGWGPRYMVTIAPAASLAFIVLRREMTSRIFCLLTVAAITTRLNARGCLNHHGISPLSVPTPVPALN